MTSTAGGAAGSRKLRPVRWEARAHDWITYERVVRLHAPPSFDTRWEAEAERLTLLVSRGAFDGGGERNVFHARFEGSQFEWVAKESKHIEADLQGEIEFHKRSLVTQSTCAAWAGFFNDAVEQRAHSFGVEMPPVEVRVRARARARVRVRVSIPPDGRVGLGPVARVRVGSARVGLRLAFLLTTVLAKTELAYALAVWAQQVAAGGTRWTRPSGATCSSPEPEPIGTGQPLLPCRRRRAAALR